MHTPFPTGCLRCPNCTLGTSDSSNPTCSNTVRVRRPNYWGSTRKDLARSAVNGCRSHKTYTVRHVGIAAIARAEIRRFVGVIGAPPHVPANRGHGCRKVVDFASRNSSVCLDNHTKPHVDHRAIRAYYLAGLGCDLGRTILEQRTNTSIAPMSAKTWQPWSRFAQPAQWILSAPSALLDDPE